MSTLQAFLGQSSNENAILKIKMVLLGKRFYFLCQQTTLSPLPEARLISSTHELWNLPDRSLP